MKNCPQGCGTVTDEKHCPNPHCPWYRCKKCEIAWNPNNIARTIPHKNEKK